VAVDETDTDSVGLGTNARAPIPWRIAAPVTYSMTPTGMLRCPIGRRHYPPPTRSRALRRAYALLACDEMKAQP
jgi:hypothetical protein